mgnify:CR=1 FL=1
MSTEDKKIITLNISKSDLKKQIGNVQGAVNATRLSLSESDEWFKGYQFYELDNKDLAENKDFFEISFSLVCRTYLEDKRNEHLTGQYIVVKKTGGVEARKPINVSEWNDTSQKDKRDITIENMLNLNLKDFKDYPVKIKKHVEDTRKKMKKNVWHKKMNVWKDLAYDYFKEGEPAKKKKRKSNKERPLNDFVKDFSTNLDTRISRLKANDIEKNSGLDGDNNYYFNHKELDNLKKAIAKVSTDYKSKIFNSAYELPQEKI